MDKFLDWIYSLAPFLQNTIVLIGLLLLAVTLGIWLLIRTLSLVLKDGRATLFGLWLRTISFTMVLPIGLVFGGVGLNVFNRSLVSTAKATPKAKEQAPENSGLPYPYTRPAAVVRALSIKTAAPKETVAGSKTAPTGVSASSKQAAEPKETTAASEPVVPKESAVTSEPEATKEAANIKDDESPERTPRAAETAPPNGPLTKPSASEAASEKSATVSQPIVLERRIRSQNYVSHAGDDPSDGPDANVCIQASDGWKIKKGSGQIVIESIVNGSLGQPLPPEESEDHYCATFHIVRSDRGRSAGVAAHLEAVEVQTLKGTG